MANPFLGEIKMFAGTFAPIGHALCNGQLLPISQNTALFSLLGTQFGGNGTSNFALPNLQGSFPMHFGQGPGLTQRDIGEAAGEAAVTLLTSEIPAHTHTAQCVTTGGSTDDPTGAEWAMAHIGKSPVPAYTANQSANVAMAALPSAGGNLPHNNLPPY